MNHSRSSHRRRRPMSAWLVALSHLLALGIALVLFALPHHVIPRKTASLGVTIDRPDVQILAASAEQPEPERTVADRIAAASQTEVGQRIAPEFIQQFSEQLAAATPEEQSGAGAARAGDFSAQFAGKFSPGEPVQTSNSYVSENLNIQINEYDANGIRFIVADIYVRDISCFRTGFAKDQFGRNISENIMNVAAREQGVLAINGDYYGIRHGGVCVRNGELYYSGEVVREICVLYWDGSIACFSPDSFDCEREVANGAYQIWNFGPALLDASGNARADFDEIYEDIYGNQPRSALGYFEPGHYCFITAEGRSDNSRGLTLDQMGFVAQSLGCKQCYNMDGGQTAQMVYQGQLLIDPAGDGRDCSDYLVIVDRAS